MVSRSVLVGAYLLDFFIGDPVWSLHPIRLIGKMIGSLETLLRGIGSSHEKSSGVILCAAVVLVTYGITWSFLYLSYQVNSQVGILVTIVMAYFTLSMKSLGDAAKRIKSLLSEGDEVQARTFLARIVGRDTSELSTKEIIRATVETVAENTSDGVIAPLFYVVIGGPPLAMAYKAINTLDSMVGYKNEQYLRLGWASAKCDDIANYLPARITGVLMVAAAFLLQMDWRTAYRIMRRDARTHESPNSGYPESALAGALQVQLGGVNYYRGIKKVTAHLGDAQKELSEQSIEDAVSVMYLTSALMLLFSLVLLGVLH